MVKNTKGSKLSREETRKQRAQGKKKRLVETAAPAETAVPEAAALPTPPVLPVEAPVPAPPVSAGPSNVLARLAELIRSKQSASPVTSHAARLLQRGTPYVAQKLGEEAVECVIELIGGDKAAIVSESADVLYHLVAAWVATGVRGEDVLAELDRRMNASERRGSDPLPSRRVFRATVGTSKIP